MQEYTIGQYAVPFLLMIVLQMFYAVMDDSISTKRKPVIAGLTGILLGLVAMVYGEIAITLKMTIAYTAYGLVCGAAASGFYDIQKTFRGKE